MKLADYPFRAEPVAALDRIKLIENGEPLVDAADYCAGLIIHEQCIPLVRLGVAQRLARANSALPHGLHLWLKTGLRSLERQRLSWNAHFANLQKEHPEWPKHTLYRQTNRFLAPLDRKAPPGHATGAAVDVFLMADGMRPVNMGFDLHNLKSVATTYIHLDAEINASRELLFDVMTDAGFSNCRDEFWHYSYGDSGWAVRHCETTCCYGLTSEAQMPDAELLAMIASRKEHQTIRQQ